MHGYKAHVATDADSDLVCSLEVTSANVNDGAMLAAGLLEQPGNTYR